MTYKGTYGASQNTFDHQFILLSITRAPTFFQNKENRSKKAAFGQPESPSSDIESPTQSLLEPVLTK